MFGLVVGCVALRQPERGAADLPAAGGAAPLDSDRDRALVGPAGQGERSAATVGELAADGPGLDDLGAAGGVGDDDPALAGGARLGGV
ncbi:hypothetical protein [Saccharopolyspora hattusasensis]|uniref:hypothetical protein n=1 Tax=Saccharopolyspora hattusasensis TaxID=1128679 RepID=UPI003D9559F6